VVFRRIAVIQKPHIARVRAEYLVGVLDRAEILLGAGADLAHIGDQAIGVSAKCAMEALVEVQIAKYWRSITM